MDIFDLVAKISIDKSEYDRGINDAQSGLSKAGGVIKNGLGTVAKLTAGAIATASAAMGAFAVSSVKAGADFDSSMAQVAATMGKSVEEIKNLRDFAMEMGSKTAFSATEAANALNYMALAGYDAETSMNMLPNVLNLAAAGGIDLASASDMVTDAQSALGLSLDETSEMVDKMAMASSKSNTSIAQLGEAFLTVGGTAKNLKGGTTELATALGVLADNGIKGSEGGTALRNIVLSLSAPTDKAAKAMKSLGLEAYDADGNLRPLNDIFNDLNGSLSTMTQGEQTEVLNTLFNKVDLKSANALLANSGKRFDELSSAIDSARGSAEKMANTQLDNLAGDITLFKSALEGAKIAVSDKLTPSIREFVQFGSKGVGELTQAFNSGGLSGAMSKIGDLLGQLVNKVVEKVPQMVKAGTELLKALAKGIVDNLPTIIDSALKVTNMLLDTIIAGLPKFIQVALQIITQLAGGLTKALPTLIPAIVEVVLTIGDNLVDNIDVMVDAAIALITALAEGLLKALPRLIEKGPVIIEKLYSSIAKNFDKILKAGTEILLKLVTGIISKLPEIATAAVNIVKSYVSAITNMLSSIKQVGRDMLNSVKSGIMEKVQDAKTWGKDLIDNFISGIKEKWETLKSTLKDLAGTVKDFIGFSEPKLGPLSNFHTYAPDMMDLFAKGIKDNEKKVTGQIEKSFDFADIYTLPSVDVKTTAKDTVMLQKNDKTVELLQEVSEKLDNMKFYLSKDTLVGALSAQIDAKLGRNMILAQRGVL